MINLREKLSGRAGFIAAVEAMTKGLKRQERREDFNIDMDSFGDSCVDNNPTSQPFHAMEICFGCAATCAVQELFGIDFESDNIWERCFRADSVNVDIDIFEGFESAIDHLRCGRSHLLGIFCDLDVDDKCLTIEKFARLPELGTYTWEDNLPGYEDVLQEIKTAWG